MPNKEHELHSTPRTTATRELVVWLCSTSILFALEASLSNEDGANNVSDGGVDPQPRIPPPADAFLRHGEDLKMEFTQLWVAMAMAATMMLMGRRLG
jgi:hypothetical protein